MPDTRTIAYLTSRYARASDTFIRGEVRQLRALGHTVHTFSIRRPSPHEVVGEEVARERASTLDLVAQGPGKLAVAGLLELLTAPGRALSAARMAAKVGVPGVKGRAWPAAYLLEAAFLARRLRALDVEHLHVHIGEGVAAVAMLAAKLAEIPYSLTIHGPNEFDVPTLLALDEKVHRAAFTVAISEFTRSQVYRWCRPGDWGKVHVVRCGVGDAFLGPEYPAPIAPDSRRFVSVGRLSEQKGQLILVEAAAILAARGLDFEVVLVGDGPMRGEIEARVARDGLGGRVRLLGWRDADGVRDEILAARAMVLPSFAEGLPVVLMEALALGRPAISTYVAGIPELIEPGVSGWLVPPGSATALAEAMASALATPPGRLAEMGRAGALAVSRRHHAATEAARLLALIAGASRVDTGAGHGPANGRAPGDARHHLAGRTSPG